MAGDTQAEYGGTRYQLPKIFKIDDPLGQYVLYGAAGNYGEIQAVREWLDAGAPESTKPSVDDYGGLVVDKYNNLFKLEKGLYFIPIYADFFAVGSGRDVAFGALDNGATVMQAIESAIKFDIYTGGNVEILMHPKFEKEKADDDLPF